jgi:hypothetical protein
MAELIDFSYARFTPAEVKAVGRVGVIRYVSSGRPLVSATRAEVDAFRAAGLAFVAVWQRGNDRALLGREAGATDARDAAAYCAGLGATDADPVYFAVDVDVTTPGQLAAVLSYFEGAASVLGWARVGVYGEHDVLAHLRDRTPMGLFWQTASWSAGRLAPFANLYQYRINQTLLGRAVDYDRSLTAYYGQWGARMPLKSSSRDGAQVLWIAIHTAEGAYDDDPANPSVDPGSSQWLYDYFARDDIRASSHAIADDDVLLDGLVSYDRAAWTLRDGNPVSDNLEMCGRAGWTRAQWLTHRPMIRNAARWAAGRCKARGIAPVRLTVAQVAGRAARGVIDHNTYTVATGDGTHWDVGPGFPWDVFLADVDAVYHGMEDSMSAAEVQQITDKLDGIYKLLAVGDDPPPASGNTHPNNLRTVRQKIDAVIAAVAAQADDEGKVLAAVSAAELADVARDAALAEAVAALQVGGGTVDVDALAERMYAAADRALAERLGKAAS